MYFYLVISDYPTITDAFAGIPLSVTSLGLSYNGLFWKAGTELAQVFAGTPATVTSLDLKWNGLGFPRIPGAELAQAFAGIPLSVTSLDLGRNGLYLKTGTELAVAFAALPAGLASLDLKRNDLDQKTGTELAVAFAALPTGLTSLDLSDNYLCQKTGTELAEAFAGLPAGLTSLDLSDNYLGRKTGAELALAFASIPATVTSLNLGNNGLYLKTGAELAVIFAALPRGITVSFKGDDLFKNKTRIAKDASLTKLRQASVGINLDLSGNGESDAQRALTPLASFAKKPLGKKRVYISNEVLVYILSFLLPKDASLPKLSKMVVDAATVVSERPSVNDFWKIGDAFSLNVFNTYFNIKQAQSDEEMLLIEDAKVPHEESIKSQSRSSRSW